MTKNSLSPQGRGKKGAACNRGEEKRDDTGTEHLSEGRKKRRRTERRDNAQGVKRRAGKKEQRPGQVLREKEKGKIAATSVASKGERSDGLALKK